MFCMYLRKSRKDDELASFDDEATLERHEKILLDLAEQRGDVISKIYREVVSGDTIADRPEVQRLLHDVESGMWEGVYVVEIERLSRGDAIDQGIVSRAFRLSDTLIITPIKTFDLSSDSDDTLLDFNLFYSRFEYKTIKRRMQRGRTQSQKEGNFIGSIPPYGYKRVKRSGRKGWTLEYDEEEKECMELMCRTRINNWNRVGFTKVADTLNDRGYRNRHGDLWTPAACRSIVRNKTNMGKYPVNVRITKKRVIDGKLENYTVKNPDPELIDGDFQAYMTEEEFWYAYGKDESEPCIKKGYSMNNPLVGIVVCGYCGKNMQRRPHGRQGSKDGLICPDKHCRCVSSPILYVEKVLVDSLRQFLDAYKLEPIKYNIETSEGIKASIRKQEKDLEKFQGQLDRQYELLETGMYDIATFKQRSAHVSRQIEDTKKRLEYLNMELEEENAKMKRKKTFVPACEKLLESYWTLDPPERNKLLKEVLYKAEYTKDTRNTIANRGDVLFKLKLYPKLY